MHHTSAKLNATRTNTSRSLRFIPLSPILLNFQKYSKNEHIPVTLLRHYLQLAYLSYLFKINTLSAYFEMKIPETVYFNGAASQFRKYSTGNEAVFQELKRME